MTGESYGTTAVALQNRGPVKVSQDRKGWRVEATTTATDADADKHLLEPG